MKHQKAIINGTAAGLLTVGSFLLCYFSKQALLFNLWLWWGTLVIYLVFMFRTVQQLDTTSFQHNLRSTFLVFVIANGLFYLFYYLLFSVFDPGLVDLQREVLQDHPEWPTDNTKAVQAVTIGQIFFKFVQSLIGGFLLAILVSVVARK